jgi:predicted acetyltransferase
MAEVATIEVATPGQRVALENLFQLYVHDFSEQWVGTSRGELGEDGRFPPYPHLDSYWREEGRVPLLIRADGRLAGFALLNRFARLRPDPDHAVAEFFVVRKHRRTGVGRAAAHAIFDRYPGLWEAAVARKNVAALAFWRRAISAHPRVSDLEETDMTTSEWNGPVMRFRVARAQRAAS